MHRIFKTVNFRLVLFYAAVFSLSVFILGVVVFYSIRTSIEQHIRTQIELDASQLMGDYRDDGIDELRHDIRERIEANPAGRLLYFIQAPDGRIIFDRIESIPPAGWHRLVTQDNRALLLLSIDLDHGFKFAVASDMEKAVSVQNTVRNAFAAAFVFSLVLGTAGGLVVSKRFLGRIDVFNRSMEEIGRQGDLSRRLSVSGSGDDFDQLAGIVNSLLVRIEKLVHEIRQVSTNIAHDLRTPLGRIRQKLEELQKNGSPNIENELESVIRQLDETLLTFSALLRIAEIESGVHRNHFVRVDLADLLHELALIYQPVAEEQKLTLTESLTPGVFVEGDRSLLNQLFVNLIENAIAHAGTGINIHLGLSMSSQSVEAWVEDNGCGIPESERHNVKKPFYRLAESGRKTGSGLGLSLVSAIAELHHAVLVLEDNQPGLKVSLRFPGAVNSGRPAVVPVFI